MILGEPFQRIVLEMQGGSAMLYGRELSVAIDKEGADPGVVSVALLTKVLADLQTVFFQIGDYHRRGSGIRETGAFPTDVTRACQLLVTGTAPGSFRADLAVAPPEDLFEDLGMKTRDTFLTLVQASATYEFGSRAEQIITDPAARSQVLRSMRAICPRSEDGYRIQVEAPDTPMVFLDGRVRYRCEAALLEPGKEEKIAIGRLVKLSLISSLNFVIDQGPGRRITCHYGPDLLNAVAEAAGKYVEIRGLAELDQDCEIQKFLEVRDLQVLDTSPIRLKSVECDQGSISFREPLEFIPEFHKDLLILTNETLDIMASGYSRRECLESLACRLIVLWDEIAQASDDTLTTDAIVLKNKLRLAIREVGR